jgi:prevent-host-death family protein
MISVGVGELRNSLSRCLDSVKAGEEIVVTDHGRPVARIVAERPTAPPEVDEHLRRLEAGGLIARATKPRRRRPWRRPRVPGKPLSQIVIEGRG